MATATNGNTTLKGLIGIYRRLLLVDSNNIEKDIKERPLLISFNTL